MIRYLQSRLNDLRDENLALRDRLKSNPYIQHHPPPPPHHHHHHHVSNIHQHHQHLMSSKLMPSTHQQQQAHTIDIIDYSSNGAGDLTPVNTSSNGAPLNGSSSNQPSMNHLHGANSCSDSVKNDENLFAASLYTPSIDGDYQLEAKNELLQQKLNELQKLQLQLNSVQ